MTQFFKIANACVPFSFMASCRDIKGANKEQRVLDPLRVYTGHTASVEDVAWHGLHDTLFASVGDDMRLMM